MRYLILAMLLACTPAAAETWRGVKNKADDLVYFDYRVTLYCGCPYTSHGDSDGSGDVTLDRCGYEPAAKFQNVANSIQWEHVVPASLMPARQFDCWAGEGGSRGKCEREDPAAQAMIFDLHNLAPSIGQMNQYRRDNRYGEIDTELREFGACLAEDSGPIFEPGDDERGDVARIWLYMADQHGVVIPPAEREMFMRWHEADPVSHWERTRDYQDLCDPG